MLGDERQAESGADAVPGRAAAGEALEDPRPLAAGDAGAGVLDGDEQERPVGRLDRDAHGPPPWWAAFSSRLARIRSKRILSTTA